MKDKKAMMKDVTEMLKHHQPQTIIHQTVNNVNNVNNTINLSIKLVKPGDERIDHISESQLLELLNYNNFDEMIREMMKLIYFNKDAPENSYWCIAYPKDKYGALQYNDETALIERLVTKKTLDKHFQNMLHLLTDKMNDIMMNVNLETQQLRNINRFFRYVGAESIKDESAHGYDDVKMMAYNNRTIPISLWKDLEIEGEHKFVRV